MQTRPPRGTDTVSSLIDLDLELMKLLARRAKLVTRLRGGKGHAATPVAVKAEKEVRAAWENNAVRFSRDVKFVRQLFSLLQELSVDTREESESRGSFNLAPARRPVAIDLPAPVSVVSSRLWAALAAARGDALRLDNVLLNDALLECVKALNQIGARFTWTSSGRPGEGSLTHALRDDDANLDEPAGLRFSGAVLYAGEDLLTLYLLAFLALPHTGKVRFTGGSGLKMADLSPLRRFLPQMGARFAHTVPHSTGLPASLEISGLLPDRVTLPADLPLEGVWAFLCAACTWNKTITVDLAALPARTSMRALAEILPLLRACSIDDTLRGAELILAPRTAVLPNTPTLAADPGVCAYILALPAFAGGTVALAGTWPEQDPAAKEAAALLAQVGLAPQVSDGAVRTQCADPAALWQGPQTPLDLRECDPAFLPLGLALAVLGARRCREAYPAPLLGEREDTLPAMDFYARFGLALSDDGFLRPLPEDAKPGAWASPGPYWTLGYALCAYVQPHLQLTNPADMSVLMPSFWAFYNALPAPAAGGVPPVVETAKPQASRRRFIAS